MTNKIIFSDAGTVLGEAVLNTSSPVFYPWRVCAAFPDTTDEMDVWMKMSPMLVFSDAATYKEKRALWRARQKRVEAIIRSWKKGRREGGVSDRNYADQQARAWGKLAYAFLRERQVQKQVAGIQWAQARTETAA